VEKSLNSPSAQVLTALHTCRSDVEIVVTAQLMSPERHLGSPSCASGVDECGELLGGRAFSVDKAGDLRSGGKTLELRAKPGHPQGKGGIFVQHAGRPVETVDNRRMVSTPERRADFHELQAE
jgi:hypothetical protein